MAHSGRSPEPLRYTAFAAVPGGGNPAGVVLDAASMDEDRMQAIAAEIGYSETAFITGEHSGGGYDVRYFSPLAEVPFCGHATVATAVALAEHTGDLSPVFHTASGAVPMTTVRDGQGGFTTTLESVPPVIEEAPAGLVDSALGFLGWVGGELDAALPPRVAFAGARHMVLAAGSRERLAALDYDFDGLAALMREHDLITLQLVWREARLRFHVRDPFPVGGVVEDPATGAAAAAFGGYLRELGLVEPPATVTLLQGEDMGRPSRLTVDVPVSGGIRVSGGASQIA